MEGTPVFCLTSKLFGGGVVALPPAGPLGDFLAFFAWLPLVGVAPDALDGVFRFFKIVEDFSTGVIFLSETNWEDEGVLNGTLRDPASSFSGSCLRRGFG